MDEYNTQGCLNIVEAAYKKCFNKPRNPGDIEANKKFLEDSELFDAWCFLSGLDRDRLQIMATSKRHRAMTK